MNAPAADPASAATDRRARQAEVVSALSAVLPAHALLWHAEDTTPYECDGLTAYRQQPLVVALPETEARSRRCWRPATGCRCRWSRAAPAPACRAVPCRTRWG